eukprot:3878654-Amphidinium_carterae.2
MQTSFPKSSEIQEWSDPSPACHTGTNSEPTPQQECTPMRTKVLVRVLHPLRLRQAVVTRGAELRPSVPQIHHLPQSAKEVSPQL